MKTWVSRLILIFIIISTGDDYPIRIEWDDIRSFLKEICEVWRGICASQQIGDTESLGLGSGSDVLEPNRLFNVDRLRDIWRKSPSIEETLGRNGVISNENFQNPYEYLFVHPEDVVPSVVTKAEFCTDFQPVCENKVRGDVLLGELNF